MRILVGCEESQAVTIELRKLGHDAFSCDIQPCSGGFPEWHFQQDIFEVIDIGWDMGIFFPPCTDLAVSGSRHFEAKRNDGRQQNSIDFFLRIANCDIPKTDIENPVGIMSGIYRKPDQIIQPYYFGDEAQKTTCLWLKNLPPLYHNQSPNLFDSEVTHVGRGEFKTTTTGTKMAAWNCWLPPGPERAKIRSKTFPGIAKAMAEQWGNL